MNKKKPDIELIIKGQKVYLDIGISFDQKRYYQTKQSHYASMLEQDGNPIKVIPIIIGKYCTIHTKSREFLEELDLNIENVYEEIGNLLAVYYASCAEEIYKRKQVKRDEVNNLPEVRNENLTNNRFAELVSDDVQIKEKSEHQAILEYLKEQQKLQKPMQKADKAKKRKPDDPPESQTQSETVSDQHLTETSDSLNSSIQINQNEILLSLTPAIQEEIPMELRMPNKTTVTKILAQQQIAFQRKATPENRKQDSQFMTLFPGLNLEQIRNNANTITRNSPTQPNAVINKKISKTNSISPKMLTEIL
ncbi:Hypothetical_protein [Hexamita inflata]|uniref:Hypothetical_protein n=1 Tax=Hexamita inflata TaxID=28002 RepID=A0AA86NSD8_9EUKA|nr:Hypothetical protein HINF_LOCUS12424 [Hexamita inflata]